MKLIDVSTPKHPNTFAMVDDCDFDFLNQWKWHCDRGYAKRSDRESGRLCKILMHRLLLSVQVGDVVDHINGEKLDNQRTNLRFCTFIENARNQKKQDRLDKTSSRYKGVHWAPKKKRFIARIGVDRKRIYLGRFKSEELAAEAYNNAAKFHFGNFSRLNKILTGTA